MRVLVCEFVTGGGMRGGALPASLAREGALMRDALARDLADLPCVEVFATHDDRLAPAPRATSRAVREDDDAWAVWAAAAAGADAAWAIAPETGGALARLTAALRASGAQVIGPDDEAIAVASSKARTAERLRARGVATPPVFRAGETPPGLAGPFVAKPDDGAGCEATRLFLRPPSRDEVPEGHIVQPYVMGEPASLTALRVGGETRLLAANRQHVGVDNGVFAFAGVTVGAITDVGGRLAALAEEVGRALPGLAGIFGIDVVLAPDGPVVIEVNPRLTTAYAGLREALGVNPASLVPPFASRAPSVPRAVRTVEIAV